MHCVPGVRAISEPYGLVHLHGLYARKQIGFDQYRILLKSYIRLLCKLGPNEVITIVIIINFHIHVPPPTVGIQEYLCEGDIDKRCRDSFAAGALSRMQSDLQHKEHETLVGVTDEGHDETVQDSKNTPMGDVKGGIESMEGNTRVLMTPFLSSFIMNTRQCLMMMRNGTNIARQCIG